ncbi:hypothetical protein [Brevibacillus sp. SAFN-007a]|uniref:hypothetical protein n=1 Tax=Brevibacillus sp. SAFN-007a TaxID=3436862 RepID=UPI003F80D7C7
MFSNSPIMSSIVPKTPSANVKPLELTPGQVFTGTVVKHYPDQMALVQIGGRQVQAKLEANLEAGQKAWLQVQPSNGVVTLKVLDTPAEATGKEASLDSLMRSLGIAETKESKAIVQALVNANLPVTKEIVQAFSQVAQRIGLDDSTVDAFLLAMKRNLPLTPDSVAGLKAFVSGKPLGQAIQQFLQEATLFLNQEESAAKPPGQPVVAGTEASAGTMGADVRQVVGQLKEKLAALPLLLPTAESAEDVAVSNKPVAQANAISQGTAQAAAGNASQSTRQTLSSNVQGTAPNASVAPGSTGLQATGAQVPASQPLDGTGKAATGLPSAAPLTGAGEAPSSAASANAMRQAGNVSEQTSSVFTAGTALQGTKNSQQPSGLPSQPNQGANIALPATAKPIATPGEQQANGAMQSHVTGTVSVSGSSSANPILDLFRHLGINHERALMGQAFGQQQGASGTQQQIETVKSLLLQISQSPAQSVPTALREAADQLLQQVTGQQLMMVQPGSHTLSQIVLQIPIRQADGEDTAFVQIESKKQGSGKLDPENCRLFFHLELSGMGTTMIDVGIVNRIVNLQIFNDSPWLEALVQGTKEQFAKQLRDVGYHLSAMRIQPVPDMQSKPGASQSKGAILADYEGVDVRV